MCDQDLIYYVKVHSDVPQQFTFRMELILKKNVGKLFVADRSRCLGHYDSQFDRPLSKKENRTSLPLLWEFFVLSK
jgi:hypothetical protein